MAEKEELIVIDAIAGDSAILLVGEDEKEWIVPVDYLPEGYKEGDWLKLGEDEKLVPMPKFTLERKKLVRKKLDMLRKG